MGILVISLAFQCMKSDKINIYLINTKLLAMYYSIYLKNIRGRAGTKYYIPENFK